MCLVGVDLILDDKVSSTDHGESSVEWELRDEEEWLTNLHTEVSVVTLGLLYLHVRDIDDLPFLIQTTVLSVLDNMGTFSILAAVYIEAFIVGQVYDSVSSVGPFLPPVSGAGTCN